MEKSNFFDLLVPFMPDFAEWREKWNDKHNRVTYRWKEMLSQRFSADGTWESADIRNTIVAADVVSLDSSLPLKRRDSIAVAHGRIPKMGMKMQMKESMFKQLDNLVARNSNLNQVRSTIFNDMVRCTNGVDERMEFVFLQALSNGVVLVDEDVNTGSGIRVDFGYLDENKFTAEKKWADESATPVSDLKRVLTKASNDGVTINYIVLAKEAYDKMRYSSEGKELYAHYSGQVVLSNMSILPVPTPSNFNAAFKDETGVDFVVIDRSVRIEKNGRQEAVKPWNKDKVIFLPDINCGSAVYSETVEELHPSNNVIYNKPNAYTLLMQWHINDPFAEFTASQAEILPVIENTGEIYQLDIASAVDVDPQEQEGDAYVTINGQRYSRTDVIAAFNAIGKGTTDSISDSGIIRKYNQLTDEEREAFLAQL